MEQTKKALYVYGAFLVGMGSTYCLALIFSLIRAALP